MKLRSYCLLFSLILLSACGEAQNSPAEVVVSPIPPAPVLIVETALPEPVVVEAAEVAAEDVLEPIVIENVESASPVELPEPIIVEEVASPEIVVTLLAVLSPLQNAQVEIGTPLRVEGTAPPKGDSAVSVSLRSVATDLVIADFPIGADGQWGGALQIPRSVVGPAILIVDDTDETTEEIVLEITLINPAQTTISGTEVQVQRPLATEAVVSGYTVFLQGRILNPVDNMMSVGVLMDNCSTFVSQYSFALGTASDLWSEWNAQIIVPRLLEGEGCIVAYTGEYRVGDWREMQVPVLVVNEADEGIRRVVMNDSAAGPFAQGASIYVSGLAIGTPMLDLQLFLKDEDGQDGERELLKLSVDVDDFGYWEANVQLPAEDAAGLMVLKAIIPDDEKALDTFEFEVK
jgi:hypothetical protein